MDDKKSLLIIDDEKNICRTLKLILNKKGFEVETVGTGGEALKKVRAKFFNMVLLDINLPDINGLELLKSLKIMYPDMEVMMMTGYGSLETAMSALNLGASSYITKPLNLDKVMSKINDKLDRQSLTWAKRSVEKALRESEEKFRNLFESNLDGIGYIDMKGNFLDCNRAFLNMIGYTLDEIKALTFQQLTPQIWIKEDELAIKQIMDKGYCDEYEKEFIKKDGTLFYVNLKGWKIKSERGDFVGMWAIIRDITAYKKAEAKLNKTLKDLKSSNTELEQFAYVASHDLQEPLRMVASFTQLLQNRYQDKLDDDANDFINYAVDGAVRMQNLINDLLIFSRVGTRGKPIKSTNMNTVLEAVINIFRHSIEETNTKITYDPLPVIMADETQMIQLLQNLISNAIKFRSEAPPRIHVSGEVQADKWIFSISDNGIGMNSEYFDRIFVIFQRLHKKDEYGGTGIGLAVCKKIIQRHRGKIWVESKSGKGSTFYFSILKNNKLDTMKSEDRVGIAYKN